MKLSEAIMLGRLYVDVPEAGDTRTCAIGMALLAHGHTPQGNDLLNPHILYNPLSIVPAQAFANDGDYKLVEGLYPWMARFFNLPCPWCQWLINVDAADSEIVFHPFDEHVATGEITLTELCDWLATLEPAETPADQPLEIPSEVLA